jgi:hypothetical protein
VGLLFATQAAIALTTAQRERRPTLAVSSRDLIGQAKGILAEPVARKMRTRRSACSRRSVSRPTEKLRDISEQLATTGEFARDAGQQA